jgi:hypothetical protein
MNLGKWLGKVVGQWFGAVEELPPGFTSGTAQITIVATGTIYGGAVQSFISGLAGITMNASGTLVRNEEPSGAIMVREQIRWKAEQARREIERRKKAEEAARIAQESINEARKKAETQALLKPPEQLVINETALRYTQDALSLADETQKLDISPELVAKLASIRQVAIEQVEIPEISPEHLALIRNNYDALAMILIYWGFEEEA